MPGDRWSWGQAYRRHLGVRALYVVRSAGEWVPAGEAADDFKGSRRVVRRDGEGVMGVDVVEEIWGRWQQLPVQCKGVR
jgi:hypothetical protein